MSRRYLVRTLLATLSTAALAVGIMAPSVHAAPGISTSTAHTYQLKGSVTLIASPQAYAATSGAQFFDVSSMPLHVVQSSYYVVEGQQEGGVYHYQYELVAARGTFASAIELAFNLTTHTQLIEVGVPTADSLAAIPTMPNGSSHSATDTIGLKTRPQQQSSPLTIRSTSGWYYTAWYDPANLVMTEVKDTINYSYDGFYVTSFNGSDWRNWGWDGWGEVSHSIGSYFNSNHTSATVWTYDHFRNGVFCLFNPATDVYYSDNNVVAHGNGGVGGYVNTWDSGGCSSWLHPSSTVGGGA